MTTMPVLIHKFLRGIHIDQCDHLCYDSKTPDRPCVCGGHNRGLGLIHAYTNTLKIFPGLLAAAKDSGYWLAKGPIFDTENQQAYRNKWLLPTEKKT